MLLHEKLTEQIIGVFYDVYNELGYGFLEKVYENALVIRLRKHGLEVAQQQPIHVFFDGEEVGHYVADLIVERKVIVEVKAVKKIENTHKRQLTNYLKATDAQVGLILNFGLKAAFARSLFTNDRKEHRKIRGTLSNPSNP